MICVRCEFAALFGRFDNSHVGIVLDLSLRAPGVDFSQEVVLKPRVNWRAVRSDVAQMV